MKKIEIEASIDSLYITFYASLKHVYDFTTQRRNILCNFMWKGFRRWKGMCGPSQWEITKAQLKRRS